MTFVITQPCIDTMDQSCVEVCPVDCIHFEEGADRMLYINPAECIDCGACQPACPVSAIFPEADVPADAQRFTIINAEWYSDPAAARALVPGGASAPQAVPSSAGAASTTSAKAANVESSSTAVASTAGPPAPRAPTAPAAHTTEVPALEEAQQGPVVVPHYNLPSRMGMITLVGVIFGVLIVFIFPGPDLLRIHGFALQPPIGPLIEWHGGIPLGVAFGGIITLFFLGGFVDSQREELGLFAAKRGRVTEAWREGATVWDRSEETRRFDQERAVQALAESRFSFPSPQYPTYRTHLNVPRATMALEFGGGGGEKVFPDILVVEYPGNYPRMVAQVETRETVSRDQAERVWKQLESGEAPLYIYVPTGCGALAKDYARAAGIKHAQIRTWRRQPNGVIVQEI